MGSSPAISRSCYAGIDGSHRQPAPLQRQQQLTNDDAGAVADTPPVARRGIVEAAAEGETTTQEQHNAVGSTAG
eukprot:SAG31_NODE_2070_length_6517_cov_7.896385_6_plen_74_part_00